MLKHRKSRWALAGLALLGTTACLGDIPNTTAPDAARATRNPTDVQAFIGGILFPAFFNAIETSLALGTFAQGSAAFTATLNGTQDIQQAQEILEPRMAQNNAAELSQGVGPHGSRNYWAAIGKVQSTAYDGLQLLKKHGTIITSGTPAVDITAQALAFAYFMQGWGTGYAALIFDTVQVVPDTSDIPPEPADVITFAAAHLKSHQAALAFALENLDSAIAVATRAPTIVTFTVTFPTTTLWFGSATAISNAQFIQMAKTLKARLLILNARTPAERAAVDWNQILTLTAGGVTTDYSMQLTNTSPSRSSGYLTRLQTNTATGTTQGRWNYRTIGPADQSGGYQTWWAAPLASRTRFNITTPDRRITGAVAGVSSPTTNGSYTTYRADDNGFIASRGTARFSAYQWTRHMFRNNLTGTNVGNTTGIRPMITADENTLMRAEAWLRLNNLDSAARFINVTRTRSQTAAGVVYNPNLPAVTAAGVPTVAGACVPRTEAGACGTLSNALRYERMIELSGIDMLIPAADSRSFNMLPEGAMLEWPIPGNVLQLYSLPPYTRGGVGQPGGAPAPAPPVFP